MEAAVVHVWGADAAVAERGLEGPGPVVRSDSWVGGAAEAAVGVQVGGGEGIHVDGGDLPAQDAALALGALPIARTSLRISWMVAGSPNACQVRVRQVVTIRGMQRAR